MRVAYICFWDAFLLDGVAKKILTQTSAWRNEGQVVEIFCLTPASRPPAPPVFDGRVFPFSSLLGRYRATSRLAAAVDDFAPDVIYLRYDLLLPPLWPVLAGHPVVVELNAPPAEYELRRSRARRYERWSRRQLFVRADGFVCVANEIAESSWLATLPQPRVVIGNSIDLDAFPESPAPQNDRLRAFFLGGPALAWHGVDKIRLLAELLPEFDFDVVGPIESDVGGPAPPNFFLHGFLNREQYEPLALRADIGIGTLAVHRRGVLETSPLKLREYLAYGLPIVLGHKDPDFTANPLWFVLELPNRESNVRECVDAVRDFALSMRGRRVPRATAEELVGVRAKEQRRLAFMRYVIDAAVAGGLDRGRGQPTA